MPSCPRQSSQTSKRVATDASDSVFRRIAGDWGNCRNSGLRLVPEPALEIFESNVRTHCTPGTGFGVVRLQNANDFTSLVHNSAASGLAEEFDPSKTETEIDSYICQGFDSSNFWRRLTTLLETSY